MLDTDAKVQTALDGFSRGETPIMPLDLVDHAIATWPDKTAFISVGQELSYAETGKLARDWSAYLQGSLGIKKGDVVGLMTPNVPAFPISCIGTLRAGATQANINPNYTARELQHQLNDASVQVLVIHAMALDRFREIAGDTPVKQVVVIGGDAPSDLGLPAISFDDAVMQGAGLDFAAPQIDPEDLIFLQYTGGTTGVSKGAMLTHRNLGANVVQFFAHQKGALLFGEMRFVTALPLYHIFALNANFLLAFAAGSTNWLVANPGDMDGLVGTMIEARPHIMTGVNTLYNAMAHHPKISEWDVSDHILSVGGGTAILPSASAAWQKVTGKPIRVGYGLSETSPLVCGQYYDGTEFTPDTGHAAPLTEIALLGDDDQPVPQGERGELCVRGPQVMRGYLGREAERDQTFTKDDFFRTGDIAIQHPDGAYEIVDRKKDMVIVSGFNVYPNEIESVVADHPGVIECACIGVPDERTGEAVKVFVVKKDPDVTPEEIIAFCRERMTGYKVPKQIEFRDSLPKSPVGKLLRRELR